MVGIHINIYHSEYADDYEKGFISKREEIQAMGWENARDKFNKDYPVSQKLNLSLAEHYYSTGEIDALLKYK